MRRSRQSGPTFTSEYSILCPFSASLAHVRVAGVSLRCASVPSAPSCPSASTFRNLVQLQVMIRRFLQRSAMPDSCFSSRVVNRLADVSHVHHRGRTIQFLPARPPALALHPRSPSPPRRFSPFPSPSPLACPPQTLPPRTPRPRRPPSRPPRATRRSSRLARKDSPSALSSAPRKQVSHLVTAAPVGPRSRCVPDAAFFSPGLVPSGGGDAAGGPGHGWRDCPGRAVGCEKGSRWGRRVDGRVDRRARARWKNAV